MSGGGSGGDASSQRELRCETINFITDVNSPQKDALAELEAGVKLDVAIENNRVVIKRPDDGSTVGSINWAGVAKLIECINNGYVYVATIREIEDGLVKVNIAGA